MSSANDGDSPVRLPTTINCLPNEIIGMIFKYVDLVAYGDDIHQDSKSLGWTPNFVFLACKRWRALAQMFPLFGRQLIIYVDEPISLPELEQKMRLSRSMKLKVFLVRRDYFNLESKPILGLVSLDDEQTEVAEVESPATDPNEGSQINKLLPFLARHVWRCQVIVFDLLHRSSLPCISNFSGYAAKLLTLRIKSRDVKATLRDSPDTRALRPFRCSNLRFLDFDGAIFARATKIPNWLSSLQAIPDKEVSISNMFKGDCDGFNLLDLVSSFSYQVVGDLKSLKLRNVFLDAQTCHAASTDTILISIQKLYFLGLTKEVISGFFAVHTTRIRPHFIKFRNCELGSVDLFHSWGLSLYDIDGPAEHINNFVRHWDGFSLCIRDCPGVDDSLFNMLAEYVDDSQEEFHVPGFTQISMSPFTNISASALKELVTARAKLAKRLRRLNPESRETCSEMNGVWMTGEGPSLSDDDRKWFQEALNVFDWNPSKAGSESSKLESDCAEQLVLPPEQPVPFHSSSPPLLNDESEDAVDIIQGGKAVESAPNNLRAARFESPPVEGDCSLLSMEDLQHLP